MTNTTTLVERLRDDTEQEYSKDGENLTELMGKAADEITRLQRENDRLQAELAASREREEELKVAMLDKAVRETMITDMSIKGGLHLAFEGGMCHAMAECFAAQFEEIGATNYVEMTLTSKQRMPGETFIVTLQRANGKTPYQLRREAEEKLAALSTPASQSPQGHADQPYARSNEKK